MKENDSFQNILLASQILRLVKAEFLLALNQTESDVFIPTPRSIKKAKGNIMSATRQARVDKIEIQSEILRRRNKFRELGHLSDLQATDLASRSLLIESQLSSNGVLYGDKTYNFCLEPLKLSPKQLSDLESAALDGYLIATRLNSVLPSQNKIETYLNSLDLSPNGARIDIILTQNGPKIIEVNFQWVDGIQSLEGLRQTYRGQTGPNPVELLAKIYRDRRKLAIILINPATGSRKGGEYSSLQIMAKSLTQRNLFAEVEIINPLVTRTSYLSNFNSFYIDGDPKMLSGDDVPDWLAMIYERIKLKSAIIFPQWNPRLDKKQVLIQAALLQPNIFAPTSDFSLTLPLTDSNSPKWILKGEGFSSHQVAITGTELFASVYQDAIMFPTEYVVQPQLQSLSIGPMWVFDTSAGKPVYLAEPNCKFNVWIIDGRVAGTSASLSANEIISDKDFNTVPVLT